MTAYRKIFLIMLAVFAAIYLAGALFYVQQARHDVQRELAGIAGLADILNSPENLPTTLVANIRHLEPAIVPVAEARTGAPEWFADMIGAGDSRALANGWRFAPADEAEEIWESFVLISIAYTVGMALCFLALYQAVSAGVKPLRALSGAMEAVGEGQLASRLPPQSVNELDSLAKRFNAMAEALEAEQNTVGRLMNELLQLQDREREHIARVLHDDLGQYLTGIRAQAQSWVYDPDLSDLQKQQAKDLAGHCETVQNHFRHLLQDLHPLVMEKLGLGSAIRHLVEQWQQLSGLNCHLDLDDALPALTGEQQTHLYRFLQEALNNISRHSRASHAYLAVDTTPTNLRVEVHDDGDGIDDIDSKAGLGLMSMRERARCMGGRVSFRSGAGGGTRVLLAIPLSASSLYGGGAL
ncbi:HAMP domain-containing protein [Marinobacter salinexigens]|uniref:Oxygen sensor histidine kinase NreB n=1 Tax=Marinobacter salinexigens TaxID=2919747 RepID=A0A5B0VNH1_9GAMM|nr:HAMP domain-containing protein [Marinobacter salinexigens]KAA1175745.1 HAMP domain-containing protein [Marinobacter salinexigens]